MTDIPLSSLENKKAEHITLLKDTISDLKQKMDNKSQVPGKNHFKNNFLLHAIFLWSVF